MGIRDVNSLTGMIFNKLSSSATQSTNSVSTAVQDFKKIVAEGGFMNFASVDTGDDVTAQPVEKEVKTANSSSNDKKAERPTAEKADKKEDAPSTKNEDKSPVEDKQTQAEDKTENKADKETVGQDSKPEKTTEKADNSKENTSDNTAEEADSASAPVDGENISSDKTQPNKNIKEQVFAAEQMIPLENLSAMNAVTVYNAVDGTYSVMTGAELVAQIENYGTEIGAFKSQNGQSDITLVNLQQAQQNQQVNLISDEGKIELVDGMETVPEETFAAAVKEAQVQPEEKKKSDTQVAANQNTKTTKHAETVEMVAPVSEQEEQISKLVGEDKKLDVKVDVKEENFAYDKAHVNVKSEVKAKNMDADSANVRTALSAANEVTPQTTVNNNVVQPLAAAEIQPQTAALNNGTVSSLSAGIRGISEGVTQSNTTNLTNLAGTETAAHNLKAEGSVQGDNKTSFRDVYKGMSREVAEQVKVNITKSAVKGVDSIEIKLKPEELGHIEVKMQISKDGKLQAHIISSRAETMDMLQKELPTLEKAFADAGFSLDNGSLSFSFRDNQAGSRENNELRQFLSSVFEQEAGNENNMAELSGYESWDGKSALNIRV